MIGWENVAAATEEDRQGKQEGRGWIDGRCLAGIKWESAKSERPLLGLMDESDQGKRRHGIKMFRRLLYTFCALLTRRMDSLSLSLSLEISLLCQT